MKGVHSWYLSLDRDFCYAVWFQVFFFYSRWVLLLYFFFHFRMFDGVSFSPNLQIIFWFRNSTPSIICGFLLFIISMVHFPMPISILITSLNILLLPVLKFPILFHICQSLWCRACTRSLWSFVFACAFPNFAIEVNIIAITNSNADSSSPLKNSIWISYAFSSSSQLHSAVFYGILINIMISPDILYILRQSIIELCGAISYAFYSQSVP